MILTTSQLKELSGLLQNARQNNKDGSPSISFCKEEYTKDGKNFRWEPKPRGNKRNLEKSGFVCDYIDEVLCVQIPLGCHGTDNLGIDPDTKEIFCLHCKVV